MEVLKRFGYKKSSDFEIIYQEESTLRKLFAIYSFNVGPILVCEIFWSPFNISLGLAYECRKS